MAQYITARIRRGQLASSIGNPCRSRGIRRARRLPGIEVLLFCRTSFDVVTMKADGAVSENSGCRSAMLGTLRFAAILRNSTSFLRPESGQDSLITNGGPDSPSAR